MKILYIFFCTVLLIYMIMPGPGKISDFQALPNSVKSTLAGDTHQISNVAGYFSNNYRNFVVNFYLDDYIKKNWWPFPPLKLNHPPEFSWNVIKKHTDSTYLEEVVYPLRDSLYINGFEPFNEDGTPRYWGATTFSENAHSWYTKTTLRFYPSGLPVKFIVWLGIVTSVLLLYRIGKKIIF